MTKVLNITMHAVNNYGSVLQALATERIFQGLGYEVETLDYIQEGLQMDTIMKIIKNGGPGWKIKFKQIVLLLFSQTNDNKKTFDDFRNKYLHLSGRKYISEKELFQDIPKADIYCTGSDQTWNTTLHGVSKAYFLAFPPDGKKRVSFAASFGIEKLSHKDEKEVKNYLSKYSAISVRESSGLNILSEIGIKNGVHVLDPTLVVDNSFWNYLSEKKQYEGDYIFVYQLNSSSAFSNYVNEFAASKGLKVLYVRSRKNNRLRNSVYLGTPKPEVVLSLFKYSSYVLTDSFHATVFSIIFHRNFVNILPPNFSTRIKSILTLMGLERRIVSDLNDLSCCDIPINWLKVDSILNEERDKTIQFLKGALN